MLVDRIVNDEVILWASECPCTDFFDIVTRTLEASTTYTFQDNVLGYPSHNLINYFNVFSDGDLIPSKQKNFEYDSCFQSKFSPKVLKTLLDLQKSK
jgi:hypothetical protein